MLDRLPMRLTANPTSSTFLMKKGVYFSYTLHHSNSHFAKHVIVIHFPNLGGIRMKNAKRSFIIGIILSLFFNITISYAEGYNPGDSFQIITDGAYKYSYAPSSIYD